MSAVLDKQLIASNNCFSMFNGSLCPLPKHLQNLLFQVNDSKVKKSNNIDNKYLKVVIVPIIFFTDDTSGGSSKQHIPYESWSMTYAALPLEERGRRENTMFIGCAPKSDGINAMHFIPALVADMKALEKGVAMFSGEHNETVLVKAPVMFISADNPAHSDICGIQQQTTLYFCRKCYVRKSSKKKTAAFLRVVLL
ncbi:hypothetical protein G6F63_014357 [Rhizopus arrhizus]|nr:hypothetical protein G6F63_014357 [Rhizopus arrhizus]